MFFKFRFGGLKAEKTQNSQNLPYVIDLVLVLLLLTLNIFNTFYYLSIADFDFLLLEVLKFMKEFHL